MDAQDDKTKGQNLQATEVLRRLDQIGAIKLEVLLTKSAEIKGIAGAHLEPGDICYKHYIRIGPPKDLELVSVAAELRQLGFELKSIK